MTVRSFLPFPAKATKTLIVFKLKSIWSTDK